MALLKRHLRLSLRLLDGYDEGDFIATFFEMANTNVRASQSIHVCHFTCRFLIIVIFTESSLFDLVNTARSILHVKFVIRFNSIYTSELSLIFIHF